MATAKWTLMGMYNYDDTIFNEMILPTGIDADLFKQSLLIEKGEFEVLFPDPNFMKNAIKIWSSKWFRTFSEWLKGTQAEWNPIYNYDRYEEGWDDNKKNYSSVNQADYSDKRTANLEHSHILNTKDERTADLEDKRTADLEEKRVANLKDERTADLEDKRTADLEEKRVANLKDESTSGKKDESTFNNADITSQIKPSTTEHKVAAYDSATYAESSQDIVNNGESKIQHVGTVTNESDGTETTSHTGSDTTATTGSDTMKHTGTDTTAHTGSDTTATTGSDTMKHSGTDTTAHTGNEINNETGTDETTHKGKLSDITGKEQNTNQHTAHLYGNIGVTTSAAMLAEFYNVAKWNLYEHMADVFGSELLIQVY